MGGWVDNCGEVDWWVGGWVGGWVGTYRGLKLGQGPLRAVLSDDFSVDHEENDDEGGECFLCGRGGWVGGWVGIFLLVEVDRFVVG